MIPISKSNPLPPMHTDAIQPFCKRRMVIGDYREEFRSIMCAELEDRGLETIAYIQLAIRAWLAGITREATEEARWDVIDDVMNK